MAEETPSAEGAAPPKGGLSLKTIIVIAAVLVIEAVVISGVFLFSGGPAEVEGGALEDLAADMEQPEEVTILEEKFQNTRSGKPYLYQATIVVSTKRKHSHLVEQRKDQMRWRIRSAINEIYSSAMLDELREPTLTTLRRKVHKRLDDLIGIDEATGEKLIIEVMIPTNTEFRSDL